MSVANLEKPISKQRTPVVDRPRVVTRPVSRPQSRPEVRMRVEITERQVTRKGSGLGVSLLLCATAFVVSYGASSLGGQVMVERARRVEISARERAIEARKTEASLRARVDALTSAPAIERWAALHGFAAPNAAPAAEAAPQMEVEIEKERAGYIARM